MITKLKLSRAVESLRYLILAVSLLSQTLVAAQTRVAIEASDPSAFRNYFWLDRRFGGLLSDYISLDDGIYKIEVFGPPSKDPNLLQDMFYTHTVELEVLASRPIVRSSSFRSYCADKGMQYLVKEWPTPRIVPDEKYVGAFRLIIESPNLIARDTPCTPPPAPSMAGWTNLGSFKLKLTSSPVGAEVWVRGRRTGTTNVAINVPYRDQQDDVDVLVRMPGHINCSWRLKFPFPAETELDCTLRAP